MDFSKYLHGVVKIDAGTKARHRPAGLRAGRPAPRGREARPELRPRPGDAHPLHPGRHARQRLLRLAFAAVRQARPRPAHRRQHARAGNPHLRRPAAARRRNAARANWSGSSARAARAANCTRNSRRSARNTPTRFAAMPKTRTCRGASPATTSTRCCRRTASTSPGPWSAPKARWSPSWKRRMQPGARTRRRGRCSCSAIPTSTRPATTSWKSCAFKPTALEGIDHLLFEFVKEKGDKNADLALLPAGKGFLHRRVRRRQQGGLRRPGPALHGGAEEERQRADDETARRSRRRRR